MRSLGISGIGLTRRLAATRDFNFLTGFDPSITLTRAGNTATRFNAQGQIETVAANTPRIDYDPVTLACRGLLIEEQRTNILPYSLDGVSTGHTANGGSLSAGGTYFGKQFTRFTADGTSGVHTLQGPTVLVTGSTSYVLAVTVRDVSAGRVQLYLGGGAAPSTVYANFNFSTGLITATGTGVSSSGVIDRGNGVYRIWICVTSNASPTNAAGLFLGVITTDTAGRSQSNTSTGAFEAYGDDLQAGAFPTSFIPTNGAQATRAADVATLALGSWFNAAEGTIAVDVGSAAVNNSVQVAFDASNATSAERIFVRRAAGANIGAAIVDDGVTQADISDFATVAGGAIYRAALGYKFNDVAMSLNGAAVTTDTAATMPTPTELKLGTNYASAQSVNGYIRRLRYYARRLPNSQLQALTT